MEPPVRFFPPRAITGDRLSPLGTNFAQLNVLLSQHFNQPTESFWNSAEIVFGDLCIRLASHPEDDFRGEEAGVSKARKAAMPVLKVYKASSWLTRTTATNENLPLVVIGSMSTKLFSQIFWEFQQESGYSIYEIDEGTGKLQFGVEGKTYDLTYLQWGDLARNFPNLILAPHHRILQTGPSPEAIQQVVELRRDEEIGDFFDRWPAMRRAYYYIRAWAQLSGLWRGGIGCPELRSLSPGDLAVLLRKSSKSHYELTWEQRNSHQLMTEIVLEFLEESNSNPWGKTEGMTPLAENQARDLEEILNILQDQPLQRLSEYSCHLKIDVIWTGSGIKGGRIFDTIERRLAAIERDLRTKVGPGFESFLWPSRLVDKNVYPNASENETYECCYVIGLRFNASDEESQRATVERVSETWQRHALNDNQIPDKQLFINYVIAPCGEGLREMKNCERIWRREIVPNPLPPVQEEKEKGQENQKPGKKLKAKSSTNNFHPGFGTPVQSSKSLRTASDILSRLKNDANLSLDEYTVGYYDRVLDKVLEKPAANWEKESTEETFISEGRIRYFMRWPKEGGAGHLVWHRKAKLDRVFGSGNPDSLEAMGVDKDGEAIVRHGGESEDVSSEEPASEESSLTVGKIFNEMRRLLGV